MVRRALRLRTTSSSPTHAISVWRRDLAGTAWAWSCLCGERYRKDLPDHDAALSEGRAHESAARNPAAAAARTA